VAEENLGTAVLRIVVDDEPARNALNLLKRDVEATAQQATRARRTTARPPTPKGGAREGTDAVERANQRIIGIQNRINLLEAKGVNITQARARLSQAIAANEQSNFGSVRQITSQLSNTLRIEEGRLRVSAAQTAELKRQNAETKSVASTERTRAQKPAGVGFATTPEQILAGRGGTQKGAASSINTAETFLNKTTQLSNRINVLAAKGVDISSLRTTFEQANAAALERQFGTSQRLIQNLTREVSLQENNLRIAKLREAADKRRLKEAATSATGTAKGQPPPPPGLPPLPPVPGFPKEYYARQARQVKEASKRQQDIISNAIIGGAFPLLFGQGIGAAAGGAAGGAGGGAIGGQFGFGLSLVGTALGAQFDLTIQKAGALAAALEDPVGQFSAIQQNALLSSKGLEKHVAALIANGKTAEAAAIVQRDLANAYADPTRAKELAAATDALNRSYTQLGLTLADLGLESIAGLAGNAALALRGFAATIQFFKDLIPKGLPSIPTGDQPGSAFFNPLSGGGGTAAVIEIGKLLGRTVGRPPTNNLAAPQSNMDLEFKGISKRLEQEQRIISASETQNKLIVAQAQGYAEIAASLERQVITETALEALRTQTDPIERVKIQIKAKQDLINLDERELERKQALRAQTSLEAAQDTIKLQSIGKQIAATQALRNTQKGVARDTLESTQAIQAGVDAARDREREIGAQIDAARQRGGDAGEQEAARLVNQQVIAANETRLELEKGADALTRAGEQLRDNLRNAIVDFTRIRSDAEGLNQFLNPVQQQQRAEQDFQLLLPQFREAQARFTQLTGARAPEFGGSTVDVNQSMRDLINVTQTESQATRDLAGTQQALATNLEAYNKTITDLATVTKTLADKNWLVNVAVSGAQSAISGDVLNGAVSP
jgi:hypothetical protein